MQFLLRTKEHPIEDRFFRIGVLVVTKRSCFRVNFNPTQPLWSAPPSQEKSPARKIPCYQQLCICEDLFTDRWQRVLKRACRLSHSCFVGFFLRALTTFVSHQFSGGKSKRLRWLRQLSQIEFNLIKMSSCVASVLAPVFSGLFP